MILTLFYVFAALMMALMGYVLLKSLFNTNVRNETNHRDVNIGIARDRKSLIKDALSKGNIDKATYDAELQDVENTLANELEAGPNNTQSRLMRGIGAVLVMVLVIGTGVLLYQRLGNTDSLQDQFLTNTGAVIVANGATVDRNVANALAAGANPKTVAQTVAEQLAANAETNREQTAASLTDLLPQLEARLQENPDDLQGWTLLGRTYMNIGDFGRAEAAIEKAYALDDSDPDVIIMLAEAEALQNEGDLTGKPQAFIQQALDMNPDHPRGNLLLALSFQQQNKHEQAIELLENLRANPGLSEQGAANLTQMISQSQIALGQAPESRASDDMGAMGAQTAELTAEQTATAAGADEVASNSDTAAPAGAATESNQAVAAQTGAVTQPNEAAASQTSIPVNVTLSDEAKADTKETDSVFIFARASTGPRMPLAVVRLSVADLPVSVTLDDSMAMIPNMSVSAFPSVTVSARISPSGDAIAKPGDWFGEQLDVLTGETRDPAQNAIDITIDQQTP